MSQFLEEDKIKANTNYKELLLRIWPYIQRNIGLFVFVVIAILSLAGVSRFLPFLIGYAIDHGLKERNPQVLLTVAYIYLFVEVVKTVMTFLHRYLFQVLGSRVLGQMRQDLLNHVQRLPMDYFHRNPAGRTVTRMTNDISVLSEVFSDGVVSLLTQAAILISICIAMIFMSLKVTLFTLISAPIFVVLNFFLIEKVKMICAIRRKNYQR